MKNTMKATFVALALGTAAFTVHAQQTDNPPGDHPNGPRGHHPPAPAIIMALDVNHDGVIDANEIANAPAELKTLDKNGDGKLTPDEFMGPRPQRGPNGGDNSNAGGNDQPPGNHDAPSGPPNGGQ